MRKILLFYCLYCLIGAINSQNLNIARHDGVDRVGNMVSINSKCYYWQAYFSNCCSYSGNIVAMNDDGSQVWKKSLQFDEYNTPKKLIKTADKSLALLILSEGCDTGPRINHICKVDTLGNALIQCSVGAISDFICHPDNSFYLTLGNSVLHYSQFLQPISQLTTALTTINSISSLSNGNLLLNGSIGTQLNNLEITTSGSVVTQHTCSAAVLEFKPTIGSVLIARNSQGVLESYDSYLNPLNNSGFSVNDYVIRNDSIFVVGNAASPDNLFYKILDLNFNLIQQYSVPYPNIYPTGMRINNHNMVDVITLGLSTPVPSMPFSGFYQFPINGGFVSKSDIGITALKTISASFSYNYGSQYNGLMNLDVSVKNYGNDTIHTFYLNFYAHYFLCYILFHKSYSTTILPGATVVVNTGGFQIQPFNYPSPPATLLYQVCLFTSIPNESNDINVMNDAFCDNISMINTGINESTAIDQIVKIFPNPFNESLNIQSDFQIKTIELTNALGSVIQTAVVNAKNYTLQNSDLKGGIYFLKIETEKGTATKKLLKN